MFHKLCLPSKLVKPNLPTRGNASDGKCMKFPDLHTKLHFLQPPTPYRVRWGRFTKTGFVRKYIKCPELYRKVMFVNSPLLGGQAIYKIFLC